jgi:hypothetical protein
MLSLHKEIENLKVFRQNRYSNYDIACALYLKHEPLLQLVEMTSVGTLLYHPEKNIHMLRSAKDKLDLKVPGIYCIPCKCSNIYAGQTGRTSETRFKEHMRHVSSIQISLWWWNTALK